MRRIISLIIIVCIFCGFLFESAAEDGRFYTVVSAGKSYTSTVAAYVNYPDTYGTELTDGLFAPSNSGSYYNGKLSGYTSSPEITVDLDEVRNDIYGFRVSYLSTRMDGVAIPASVGVKTSPDGEVWSDLMTLVMPEYVAGTTQAAELFLGENISARYIRFNVNKSWVFVFLDEVEVIADVYTETADDIFNRTVDAAYLADTLTAEERAQALSGVSTAAPDRTLEKHLLSESAEYVVSATALEAYPDGSKKLTDGKTEKSYDSGAWVGFPASQAVSVTVELAEEREDIAEMSLFAYSNPTVGISFPVYVDFEVSSDNESFVSVGRVYGPSKLTEIREYELKLETCVRAKYVRFTFVGEQAEIFLIDEAAVYGYGEKEKVLLYPDIVIPDITENEYWDSSAADFNDTQNLLLGLPMQVMCGSEPPESDWHYQTPMPCDVLTDGVYSTTLNVHASSFFQSHGDTHRDIVFDLTKVSALSTFRAGFAKRTGWGVYSPSEVDICVSVDGDMWYEIGSIILPDADDQIERASLELASPVLARFVCFTYEHTIWGGCDELEAYGSKNIDGAVDPSTVGTRPRHLVADKYQTPSENILSGVRDLLIAYYSKTFDWTEQYFRPYLAYLDRDYNAQDVMFDGFLFAMSGDFPSGQLGYQKSVMTDWAWELDKLFTDGKNLDALNTAAGNMINELELGDFKYKFYVSIYYPDVQVIDFGDVDGDGITENLSLAEDRIKVEKWYIDSFYSRYNSGSHENLEFGGFYWYNEAILPTERNIATLNGVADIIHERGSQFFWIPYYLAKGFNCWEVFGFDACSMQPNYAFSLDAPISKIEVCSRLSKRYGMCNEIEFTGSCFSNDLFLARYYEYLKGGLYYGYDEATHTYYQDITGYYNACYSKSEKARRIYDYTYQFISGTLDISKSAAEMMSLATDDETALCSNLKSADNDPLNTYRLYSSPLHGTVSVNKDGTFRYYPDKNFIGCDSFSYVYNNTFTDSEVCTVNISVGKLKISSEAITLNEGGTEKLTASYSHAVKSPDAIWESGNSYIASVSSDGTVSAHKSGNVLITAKTSDGNYSAQCLVRVLPTSAKVSITCLSGSTDLKISWWKKYSSAEIALGAVTYNCPNASIIVWSSSNAAVKVDSDGIVKNTSRTAKVSIITVRAYDENGTLLATGQTNVKFYKFNWQLKLFRYSSQGCP